MTTRPKRSARVLAGAAAIGLMGAAVGAPAVAADESGDVDVVNTETIQIYTDSAGDVESQRIYEQLTLTGKGTVNIVNPVSTDGLRNLDGFSGFTVKDGNQITDATVDGRKYLRSVSTFDGTLPLDVSVAYELDGEQVEPGDVVGADGRLKVTYTIKNITSAPQEVSFPDGTGGTMTSTVDVPIPMVGSMTTTLPKSFTDVSTQGNMVGDGEGGTTLAFTMTLFPPLGSDTAVAEYSATIRDGVVPDASISALPVNPVESPTFKTAAESYQGGAETGGELAAGADQIDQNLLKLRDGASDLLAGLIKLHAGAGELSAGLTDDAAPGANKLADGAGDLNDGLGELSDGTSKLAGGTDELDAGANKLDDGAADLNAGAGKLDAGANKLDDGAGKVAGGAKKLSGGTGSALAGSKKLTGGLSQISDGLGDLADANTGLPGAVQGIKDLQAGVDQLLAALGTAGQPQTLIGGLTALTAGLGEAQTGAATIAGGLGQLNDPAGLPAAKGGVDQVKAGLAAAVAPGGSLDQLLGGLAQLKATAGCQSDAQCTGIADNLTSGVQQSKSDLSTANAGLGQVSGGLATAIGAVSALNAGATELATKLGEAEAGAATLTGGATQLKGGVTLVSDGLAQLEQGVSKAVAGVLQLSAGADSAYSGSSDLTDGLGQLDSGATDLSAGAGDLAAGAGDLAAGTGDLAAGTGKLADGTGDLTAGARTLSDGAHQLDDGAAKAKDGSGLLADGAATLAAGLVDAAVGSGKIAVGLGDAADGAPKLVDGANRLSVEGTSQLVKAGEKTAQDYGVMYATMQAGAERADSEGMAYGAPEGAFGVAAYSYQIQGQDGEGGRNWARSVTGVALLGAAGGAFFLRRRFL